MLRSMTGFASKIIEVQTNDTNKAFISLILKSLNSRFFEVSCKLPHALQPLEIEFIKMFKDALHRGKVTFNVTISNPLLFSGPIEPSFYMVQNYLQAIEKIQQKYGINSTITMSDLLRLPHIFTEEESTINQSIHDLIIQTTQQLIASLSDSQKKEGTILQKDIEERLAIILQKIIEIESLAGQLIVKNNLAMQQKLEKYEQSSADIIALTKHQLYAEMERMDIHEEIIRFKSHLTLLNGFINSTETEKGRRIDFTLQELTREINTIGAKCADPAIGSLAIAIKVELEKIREQAQNIV